MAKRVKKAPGKAQTRSRRSLQLEKVLSTWAPVGSKYLVVALGSFLIALGALALAILGDGVVWVVAGVLVGMVAVFLAAVLGMQHWRYHGYRWNARVVRTRCDLPYAAVVDRIGESMRYLSLRERPLRSPDDVRPTRVAPRARWRSKDMEICVDALEPWVTEIWLRPLGEEPGGLTEMVENWISQIPRSALG